ncbi:MAG: hypothetical protein K2X06_07020 [Burkholderiales bacterium]|nr:hypothetical protein [Burkholderiales bacterium]
MKLPAYPVLTREARGMPNRKLLFLLTKNTTLKAENRIWFQPETSCPFPIETAAAKPGFSGNFIP